MYNNEEVIGLLREIRDYLSEINDKLLDIKTNCESTNDAVAEITQNGLYSLEDVIDKLSDIENSVDNN